MYPKFDLVPSLGPVPTAAIHLDPSEKVRVGQTVIPEPVDWDVEGERG